MAEMSRSFLESEPERKRTHDSAVVKLEYPSYKKAGFTLKIKAIDTEASKYQELLLVKSEVNELALVTHAKADNPVRDGIIFDYLTSIDDKELLKLLNRVHFRRHAETIPLRDLNFSEELMKIFEEENLEVVKDITKNSAERFSSLINDDQLNDEVVRTLNSLGHKLKSRAFGSV